jgi:hypothetical protein
LFLNEADSARVARTFLNLARHDISGWALTGGVAIELHILRLGGKPIIRRLNDLDFVAVSFDAIPESIGSELLLRHVHPADPPSKMMLQGVDPETGVRVDVFRAYGMEMERTSQIECTALPFKTVSLQDLVARHARLSWDVMEGRPVAPKYARDFLRLIELVTTDDIERIWQEHRKGQSPESFAEPALQLRRTIASRSELLIAPAYSTNVHEVCPRCQATGGFRLCDPCQILYILGYC